MKDIRFYLWVFRRRLPWFLAAWVAVSGTILYMVSRMTPVYVSSMSMTVETPQLPNSVSGMSVATPAEEHLQRLQQGLRDPANLLEIARKLKVQPDQAMLTDDEIVANMRGRTKMGIVAGRDIITTMNVSFEAPSGAVAYGVMSEYYDLIQRENTAYRVARATDALNVVRQDVEKLRVEADRQAQSILDFKNAHTDALPEDLDYRMRTRAAFQDRLSTTERDLTLLQDERRRAVEYYERTGQVSDSSVRGTPEQQELAKLKAELSASLIVLSPENPRVKALQARIAQLEQFVTQQFGGTGAEGASTLLDVQLADVDAKIAINTSQKADLERQIAELNGSIERTSRNSVQLTALQGDYNAVLKRYNDALERQAQAETGVRIENETRGQGLLLTEPPVVPDNPARPNRRMLGVVGIALGLIAGICLVVLLELLNRTVRRPEDLYQRLGVWPIATLPYIPARKDYGA